MAYYESDLAPQEYLLLFFRLELFNLESPSFVNDGLSKGHHINRLTTACSFFPTTNTSKYRGRHIQYSLHGAVHLSSLDDVDPVVMD